MADRNVRPPLFGVLIPALRESGHSDLLPLQLPRTSVSDIQQSRLVGAADIKLLHSLQLPRTSVVPYSGRLCLPDIQTSYILFNCLGLQSFHIQEDFSLPDIQTSYILFSCLGLQSGEEDDHKKKYSSDFSPKSYPKTSNTRAPRLRYWTEVRDFFNSSLPRVEGRMLKTGQ